ncbi:hypothetical protein HOY34_20185 [Xinfangfangia sp. D13-10-4-6]|uniref:hypothetical protein n=1 Tax=Pseudogemmobacter hezensis TaxID=2737662 RepID=UPI0015532664|nr:hypothetical protein [Pseudogemmobacter hezensis]NPD17506.1 hypothetical protein [Pseudogemmobacter hezensis]
MILEIRSASLAKAAADREAIQRLIIELDKAPVGSTMTDTVEAQRYLAYEAWAAGRRTQLNHQLARKEVIWQAELDAARAAFGRNQVLERLQMQRDFR